MERLGLKDEKSESDAIKAKKESYNIKSEKDQK
jgi:hypothetical protein